MMIVTEIDASTLQAYRALVRDQQMRLDNDRPISSVPLLWLALAASVGLVVDPETGRIVGGPHVETGVMQGAVNCVKRQEIRIKP